MAKKNDFLELTEFTWARDKHYWVGYGYLIKKIHISGGKYSHAIYREKDVRLCPYGASIEGYNKITIIHDLRDAKNWCRENSLIPDNDRILALYKLKYDYWLSLSHKGLSYLRDLFFSGDEGILDICSSDGRWLFTGLGVDTLFKGKYCIIYTYNGTFRKENCNVYLRKDCLYTREKANPMGKCIVTFTGDRCLLDALDYCKEHND